MILHTTNDELIWEEVNHHVLNRVTGEVAKVLQAEIFYYKNEEVSIRSTLKLQEMKKGDKLFNLHITNYSHVSPHILRLEFTESKHIGDYATLAEAKEAALHYYLRHYHPKHIYHQHL